MDKKHVKANNNLRDYTKRASHSNAKGSSIRKQKVSWKQAS